MMVHTSSMKSGATRTQTTASINKENLDSGSRLKGSKLPVRIQPKRSAKDASQTGTKKTPLADKASSLSRLPVRTSRTSASTARSGKTAAKSSSDVSGKIGGTGARRVAGRVPDFSKLHQAEQARKERVMASKARKITSATAPKLSTSSRNIASRRAGQRARDTSFMPRRSPSQRTGINSGVARRPTTAPATPNPKVTEFQPFNLSVSNKKKKKERGFSFDDEDDFGFTADPTSLESILEERGIQPEQLYRRQTTVAMTREETEASRAKRVSIFNGPIRVPLKQARMTLAGTGSTSHSRTPAASGITGGLGRASLIAPHRRSLHQGGKGGEHSGSPSKLPVDLVVTPRKGVSTPVPSSATAAVFTPRATTSKNNDIFAASKPATTTTIATTTTTNASAQQQQQQQQHHHHHAHLAVTPGRSVTPSTAVRTPGALGTPARLTARNATPSAKYGEAVRAYLATTPTTTGTTTMEGNGHDDAIVHVAPTKLAWTDAEDVVTSDHTAEDGLAVESNTSAVVATTAGEAEDDEEEELGSAFQRVSVVPAIPAFTPKTNYTLVRQEIEQDMEDILDAELLLLEELKLEREIAAEEAACAGITTLPAHPTGQLEPPERANDPVAQKLMSQAIEEDNNLFLAVHMRECPTSSGSVDASVATGAQFIPQVHPVRCQADSEVLPLHRPVARHAGPKVESSAFSRII